MGLLVQDRRRDKLLTNVQNFSIAGTTMPSARVKVEYDLHTHGVIVIKPPPHMNIVSMPLVLVHAHEQLELKKHIPMHLAPCICKIAY